MGTRNLVAVFIDGEYKVAQYGQWDGYPDGQGATCLEFCKRLSDVGFRKEFERKIRACQWITQADIDAINARIESGDLKSWQKVYPELSRDTGGEILRVIVESDDEIKLRNSLSFAAEFDCEYAWIIDLDNNTFEGYCGFNKTPLAENERFFYMENQLPEYEKNNGWHPVALVAKWNLDDLPTKDEMCKAFETEIEETDPNTDMELTF